MSNYRKGARAEYELAQYLWDDGWWTVRQAASGAVSHEACDVAAMKDDRVLIFEVKTEDFPINFGNQLLEAKRRVGEDNVECYFVAEDGPTWLASDIGTDSWREREDMEPIIRVIR